MNDQPAPLAPEIEPIVLAVLEQRVKNAKTVARAMIERRYSDGHRETIRSPLDDAKLGTVYRTDPDPTWTITNREALAAHLAEDPANVEYIDDIAGTDAQVIDVLREHAPHLLAQVERVREDAVAAAVDTARRGGTVAPGLARVKPGGTLVVRPDKNASTAIERMVAAGLITWDGRPELPAAASKAVPA